MFDREPLLNMLEDFGENLTLTLVGDLTYNPASGSPASTDSTSTVRGYFYNYDVGDVAGASILFGDRKLVLSPVDTLGNIIDKPQKGDKVSGQDDTVVIVNTREITSGGVAICYICDVKE